MKTTLFLFKDTITTNPREVDEAIDFALRFARYDEDDETPPPAYVHETEDGRWAVSRDNRGVDANPTSSQLLMEFETEHQARTSCRIINDENRPEPDIIELPDGVEFVCVESIGGGAYRATIRVAGKTIQNNGYGETSYRRSGVEGAARALERAVHAAGFTDWRVADAVVKAA